MGSWTKEQFLEFCQRCGVNPKKALEEGKIDLRPHAEKFAGQIYGSLLGVAARKKNRKKRLDHARRDIYQLQDSKCKPTAQVALDKEESGQTEGMESASPSYRITVTGYRVRPIDPDNFAAGCKGIIDGIVRSKIVPDDSWEQVEIVAIQVRVSTWSKECTGILIESIE